MRDQARHPTAHRTSTAVVPPRSAATKVRELARNRTAPNSPLARRRAQLARCQIDQSNTISETDGRSGAVLQPLRNPRDRAASPSATPLSAYRARCGSATAVRSLAHTGALSSGATTMAKRGGRHRQPPVEAQPVHFDLVHCSVGRAERVDERPPGRRDHTSRSAIQRDVPRHRERFQIHGGDGVAFFIRHKRVAAKPRASAAAARTRLTAGMRNRALREITRSG